MAYKEIKHIFENIIKKTQYQDLNLKSINDVLFNLLENKGAEFKEFKNDIRIRWENFQKRNQSRTIKKSFTSFFYENFHNLFSSFLKVFFNFSENSLELFSKEKLSEKIIFFEYNYQLNSIEEEKFRNMSNVFQIEILYGFSIITGYLYFIVRLLGMVIRYVTQENIFVLLDAITIKKEDLNKNLNFLIICKDSKDEVFESYYYMVLFYFLRQIKEIPESFFKKLYMGREKLYEIALNEYAFSKEKLVDLLYYFYKKCNLLQSFSPLLDFFNFVGARVEDSVFSKIEVIKKEFLVNVNYTTEKKMLFSDFLNILIKNLLYIQLFKQITYLHQNHN